MKTDFSQQADLLSKVAKLVIEQTEEGFGDARRSVAQVSLQNCVIVYKSKNSKATVKAPSLEKALSTLFERVARPGATLERDDGEDLAFYDPFRFKMIERREWKTLHEGTRRSDVYVW